MHLPLALGHLGVQQNSTEVLSCAAVCTAQLLLTASGLLQQGDAYRDVADSEQIRLLSRFHTRTWSSFCSRAGPTRTYYQDSVTHTHLRQEEAHRKRAPLIGISQR